MEWKTEYATGIHDIDRQHRIVLRLGAHFDQAFEDQANWAGAYLLILRARSFLEYHFCAEQSLMQLLDIPNAAVHCARNRITLAQITAFQQQMRSERTCGVLLQSVRELLLDHVLGSNHQFGVHALDDWQL